MIISIICLLILHQRKIYYEVLYVYILIMKMYFLIFNSVAISAVLKESTEYSFICLNLEVLQLVCLTQWK